MSTTPTTVRFESGATREVYNPDHIVGLSADGRIVVDDGYGYLFGLTLCCNAYDKGYSDGVFCRKCGGDDAGEYDAIVSDPIVREVTA